MSSAGYSGAVLFVTEAQIVALGSNLPLSVPKEMVMCAFSRTVVISRGSRWSATYAFTNLIPWWDAAAASPACDMSYLVDPSDALSSALTRLNGSLAGLTIRSGPNPMSGLLASSLAVFAFGVLPVALFAALGGRAFRVLRPTAARDAPTEPIIRLVLFSNLVITGTLVVSYCAGGGFAGLLLPDLRFRPKLLNISSLCGASAAVDVLLGHYISNIMCNAPPKSRPSRLVLACCVA